MTLENLDDPAWLEEYSRDSFLLFLRAPFCTCPICLDEYSKSSIQPSSVYSVLCDLSCLKQSSLLSRCFCD
eukprot:525426-Amphidinium_carterae.1